MNYVEGDNGDSEAGISSAGWTFLGQRVQPIINSTAKFTYL